MQKCIMRGAEARRQHSSSNRAQSSEQETIVLTWMVMEFSSKDDTTHAIHDVTAETDSRCRECCGGSSGRGWRYRQRRCGETGGGACRPPPCPASPPPPAACQSFNGSVGPIGIMIRQVRE